MAVLMAQPMEELMEELMVIEMADWMGNRLVKKLEQTLAGQLELNLV